MRRVSPLLLSMAIVSASGRVGAAPDESYIHFKLGKRAEIQTLTNVVSLEKVRGHDAWAYATDAMLANLSSLGYTWELLPYPGRDPNVRMASSTDELTKTWASYPTYGQYVALMQEFAAEHADICRLVEIGTSQLDRQLLALKISDHPDTAEDEPEVLYTSTMHGNEPMGYVLMLRLANEILSGYGTDPRLTTLVNETELWINPLANPDGTYAGGDDTVKYATRVLANGVNFNRNFPDFTAGDHPDGNDWAPETLAMMDFAFVHHFTLSGSLHTGSEVVNYPWDTTGDRHPDDAWFQAVSRAYATQAQLDGPNKYLTELNDGITDGFDWFEVNGGRQDYMVYFHGDREVTLELLLKYLANSNEVDTVWTANRTALLQYLETALTGVRGVVSDRSGRPLLASVGLVGQPSVGSPILTDPAVGDYHRMLLPGSYTLRIGADGYRDEVQTVTVNPGAATRLDVRLKPSNG